MQRLRKSLIRLLLLAGTPIVLLVVGEIGFRMLKPRLGVDEKQLEAYRALIVEGRSTQFAPRPHTVYGRHASTRGINSLGFRSSTEWPIERKPNVPRIVCLGGSTTEGGVDAGAAGTFPAYLELLLEAKLGRDFEVFNCGTSGWDSSQSLVAFFLLVQDYRPDLVILHHSINDATARNRADFRPDYSHFWRPWSLRPAAAWKRVLVGSSDLVCWLGTKRRTIPNVVTMNTHPPVGKRPYDVHGTLPIETAEPFRRNVESIGQRATSWGGQVLFLTMPLRPEAVDDTPAERSSRAGVAQHNQIMRDLAAEHGWLVADADRIFAQAPDVVGPMFADVCHVDSRGNALKARVILRALETAVNEEPEKVSFLSGLK